MHMCNSPICKVINDMMHDLQEPYGNIYCLSVAEIQVLMPAEYIVTLLPDAKTFGTVHKYFNDS